MGVSNKNTSINNNHQPIRSFIRRNRRLTSNQIMTINSAMPLYGIQFQKAIIDLNAIFSRCAPKILDIGPGIGTACMQIANNNRDNDYLAVEVHRPGIANLLRQIEKQNIPNIRLIDQDVVDVLKYQLADNSIDEIYIFFPDPWHKKKHHKRRLINLSFISLIKQVLKSHGRIFIATDWHDYAKQIIEMINEHTDIINLAGNNRYAPRPRWRPITKFEQRSVDKGDRIYEIALAFRY